VLARMLLRELAARFCCAGAWAAHDSDLGAVALGSLFFDILTSVSRWNFERREMTGSEADHPHSTWGERMAWSITLSISDHPHSRGENHWIPHPTTYTR